jgi:hypothetical protein
MNLHEAELDPDDESRTNESARPDGEPVELEITPAAEMTSEIPPEPAIDAAADDSELAPADAAVEHSPPIDSSEPVEPAAPAPPKRPPPAWVTQTDWSKVKPAPGYEDPATGKIRFLPMGVDESGIALTDLMQGRRRVFDPQINPPQLGAPPPLPFFAAPPVDGGGKSLLPGGRPGQGASPLVRVDVQLSFTPEGTRRVTKDVLQAAAEFSRTEIRIVGQKLTDHMDDQRRLENARRIAWGR